MCLVKVNHLINLMMECCPKEWVKMLLYFISLYFCLMSILSGRLKTILLCPSTGVDLVYKLYYPLFCYYSISEYVRVRSSLRLLLARWNVLLKLVVSSNRIVLSLLSYDYCSMLVYFVIVELTKIIYYNSCIVNSTTQKTVV